MRAQPRREAVMSPTKLDRETTHDLEQIL